VAQCYFADAAAIIHLGCPIAWDLHVLYRRLGNFPDGKISCVVLPMAPISYKLGYSGPMAIAAGGSREAARRLYE